NLFCPAAESDPTRQAGYMEPPSPQGFCRAIDRIGERAPGGALLSASSDPSLFELLQDRLEGGVHRHRRRLLLLGAELPLELAAGTTLAGCGPGALLTLLPIGQGLLDRQGDAAPLVFLLGDLGAHLLTDGEL